MGPSHLFNHCIDGGQMSFGVGFGLQNFQVGREDDCTPLSCRQLIGACGASSRAKMSVQCSPYLASSLRFPCASCPPQYVPTRCGRFGATEPQAIPLRSMGKEQPKEAIWGRPSGDAASCVAVVDGAAALETSPELEPPAALGLRTARQKRNRSKPTRLKRLKVPRDSARDSVRHSAREPRRT